MVRLCRRRVSGEELLDYCHSADVLVALVQRGACKE